MCIRDSGIIPGADDLAQTELRRQAWATVGTGGGRRSGRGARPGSSGGGGGSQPGEGEGGVGERLQVQRARPDAAGGADGAHAGRGVQQRGEGEGGALPHYPSAQRLPLPPAPQVSHAFLVSLEVDSCSFSRHV